MTAVATLAVLAAAGAGALLPPAGVRRLRAVLDGPARPRSSRRRSWSASRAERREIPARRAAVVELCEAMSAELATGAAPFVALVAAGGEGGPFRVLGLRRLERGDVAAALRWCSGRRGAEGLLLLETCWRVSERTGSSLARPVARLAEALRDDEHVRRELAVQLAGVRATTVLLTVLPLGGLALGSMLGVAPLGLLVHTPLGRACAVLGLAFEFTGYWWMRRITRAAEPA